MGIPAIRMGNREINVLALLAMLSLLSVAFTLLRLFSMDIIPWETFIEVSPLLQWAISSIIYAISIFSTIIIIKLIRGRRLKQLALNTKIFTYTLLFIISTFQFAVLIVGTLWAIYGILTLVGLFMFGM